MRPRVSKLHVAPAQGVYDGPLDIQIYTETKGADIMFTRDGNVPYVNSGREHAFRCENFPVGGKITLQGRGTHVLTCVATKPGHVQTQPRVFKFTLRSGVERIKTKTEKLRDVGLNSAFQATATFEPSTALDIVQRRDEKTIVALAETANMRALSEASRAGSKVALFVRAATGSSATYGFSAPYRHVVAPSMTLSIPSNPTHRKGRSPVSSLRSDGPFSPQRAFRPPSAFSALGELPPAGDLGDTMPPDGRGSPQTDDEDDGEGADPAQLQQALSLVVGRRSPPRAHSSASRPVSRQAGTELATRPQSRASTALGGAISHALRPGSRALVPAGASRPQSRATASRASQRSRPEGPAHAPVPLVPPAGTRTMAQQQLGWFELRSRIVGDDPDDDNEEAKETDAYVQGLGALVDAEIARVGRLSERFEKQYAAPVSVSTDLASDSKKLMQVFLQASAAKTSGLAAFLRAVPYDSLADAIRKRATISGQEMASVSNGALSDAACISIIRKTLAPASNGMSADAKPSIQSKTLLLMARYLVWLAYPVPEAPIGLAVHFFRDDAPASAAAGASGAPGRTVSKLEYLTMLEAYRRSRGAHPQAVAHVTGAFHRIIDWGTDGEAEADDVVEVLRQHPVIAEALERMDACEGDAVAAMYRQRLPAEIGGPARRHRQRRSPPRTDANVDGGAGRPPRPTTTGVVVK